MENTFGLIGAITGIVGLLVAMLAVLVSVLVVRRQEKIQAVERERIERTERLIFLSDRIFDISIPRDLRLPFYEEYISMKGNGTAVKFWLMEGEMKNKE